ncbi:hypothetical protein ACFV4P_28150 [Kitasatospora sp. NPDC059795]|uniref:hypothetical protein n=1 Tax=Kitasatospora sp. NPDC059795 TaxID=3346949 RepID=UPI00365134AC
MPIKPPESQSGASTFDPGQEFPALKYGVWGDSDVGAGVIGASDTPMTDTAHVRPAGVVGVNKATQGVGVEGFCAQGTGVLGIGGADQPGVLGRASTGPGVTGVSAQGAGVTGEADSGPGVLGRSAHGVGVTGRAAGTSAGVTGESDAGPGMSGTSAQGVGVSGQGGGTSAGVTGQADSGPGVIGTSTHGVGVAGAGTAGPGVSGTSTSSPGVTGSSTGGPGVVGASAPGPGVAGSSTGGPGISGTSTPGPGVSGNSTAGPGVSGSSTGGPGVAGTSTAAPGVSGTSALGPGVSGGSTTGTGVLGTSQSGTAVSATSTSGEALSATTGTSTAAAIYSHDGVAVAAFCGHPEPEQGGIGFGDAPNRGPAVRGHSWFGHGLEGISEYDAGVSASGSTGLTASGSALGADISNGLRVNGVIVSAGSARFVIDHPLDPAENTLTHAFVASPEQKNVYDGVVTLDDSGAATVTLPDWFDALNQRFRYQLTPIGTPAPGLYVSAEISDNSFSVAGGTPGGRVSWQVTGVRLDKWAQANPVTPVTAKPSDQRGLFLHPTAFDQPAERGIGVPPVPVRQDDLPEEA